MLITAYNATRQSLTVDFQGRQVHSRDWGTVNTLADEAKPLLEAGDLIPVDVDGDDVSPAAAAAAENTERVKERVEQATQLDKPDLAELVGLDPELPKDHLVYAVAASDVEIPSSEPPAEVEAEASAGDEQGSEAAESDSAAKRAAKTTAASRRRQGEGT